MRVQAYRMMAILQPPPYVSICSQNAKIRQLITIFHKLMQLAADVYTISGENSSMLLGLSLFY